MMIVRWVAIPALLVVGCGREGARSAGGAVDSAGEPAGTAAPRSAPLGASAGSAAADSARRFVQAFYDWYVPLAASESLHAESYDSALVSRRAAFAPALLAALREDI